MINAAPHSYILGSSGIQYGHDEQGRFFAYFPEKLYTKFFGSLEEAEKCAIEAYGLWLRKETKAREEFYRQIAID